MLLTQDQEMIRDAVRAFAREQLWPNAPPAFAGARHDAWAFPRPNGKWDTYRYGHRWDPNWGDAQVKGYNPQPEIVGGAIYDVVVKRNSSQSFIQVETIH